MSPTAIILAGGKGTRLRDVVADLPKPLAAVNNKPFLSYLLDFLNASGITRVILSVGYKAEMVIDRYGSEYKGIAIKYAREEVPLGTGGAVRFAMKQVTGEQCLVLNGDSFFDLPLAQFIAGFNLAKADAAIALRYVDDTSRYGAITTDENHLIRSFAEKSNARKPGHINAGVYLLCRTKFLAATPENAAFSIEHDYFASQLSNMKLYGFPYEGYFIDIGIPQDYQKAQDDFKRFKY